MTENEIIEALKQAAHRPAEDGEGMRVEEIQAQTGFSEVRVRNLLRQGLASGTIRRTRRFIEDLSGRRVNVSGYALVAKKKR